MNPPFRPTTQGTRASAGDGDASSTQTPLSNLAIAMIYAAAGVVWILVSDTLASALLGHGEAFELASKVKGWLFVALTAALLYWLLDRQRGPGASTTRVPRRIYRIAFVIASIGVLALTFHGARVSIDHHEELARSSLTASARLDATRIGEWLQMQAAVVTLVSGNRHLADAMERWERRRDVDAMALLRDRIGTIAGSGHFDESSLRDSTGAVVFSTRDTQREPEAMAAAIDEAAISGRSRRIAPVVYPDGDIGLAYVIPLPTTGPRRAVATFGLRVAPHLARIFAISSSDYVTEERVAVRRDGSEAIRIVMQGSDAPPVLEVSRADRPAYLDGVRLSESALFRATDSDEQPILVAIQPIETSEWALVHVMPIAAIYAAANHELIAIVLGGMLFIFLVGAGLVVLEQLVTSHLIRQGQLKQLQSMSLLSIIADSSRDAIFAKDLEGHYLLANAAAAKMVGKPLDEMMGATDRILLPPEQAERIAADDRTVVESDAPIDVEETIETADGPRIVHSTKAPLRGEDGRLIGVFGIARDITERRQMEDRLRQSESRFLSTFQRAPVGIALVAPDGHWLRVNARFCSILGYTPDELQMQPVARVIHSEDYEICTAQMRRLIAGEIDTYETEKRVLTKSGRPAWINLTVSMTWRADRTPDYFIWVIEDATAENAAQADLQASEARMRLFIEHAPVAIAMLDCELRYIAVSQRWLDDYRIGARKLVGELHYEVFPQIPEQWKALYLRGLAGEILRSDEDRFVRPDGTVQWLRWEIRPWRGADRKVGGILLYTEDITEQTEARRALEASERRFADVADASADWIWEIDAECRYTYASDGVRRVLGFERDEVIGRTPFDFMPEDEAARVRVAFTALAEQRLPLRNLSNINQHRNGTRRHIETSGSAIVDDAGRLLGYRGIDRDVTESRLAEIALKHSAEKYLALFNGASFGILLLEPTTGMVLDINPRAQEILGNAAAGRFPDLHFLDPPFSLDDGRRWISRTLEEGPQQFEWLIERQDGTRSWVDLRLQTVVIEGKQRVLCFGIDITERKRANDQLRKLSMAIEQSSDTIIITDLARRIEYVNSEFVRATGYSREEALGRDPRMLGTEMTPPAVYGELEAALRDGRSWQGEFINRRKNGETFTHRSTIQPLRDGEGRITHYIAVQTDVSMTKQLNEELDHYRQHLEDLVAQRTAQLVDAKAMAESANMAKSTFLAIMSHEIRTPMNAVIGLARMIERDLGEPRMQERRLNTTDLRDRAAKIGGAAQHLLHIVNDILDLSKIEAGKLSIEAVDFEPRKVVAGVLQMIAERATANGTVMRADLKALPERLHGDGMRVGQILLNFLSNAVKFTRAGRVDLVASPVAHTGSGLRIRFEVRDTGIGMSEQQCARLFQPFEQADSGTTRVFGGTGLGLAISRRLAELMGGQVGVQSQEGEGSTFWFEAPFDPASATTDAEALASDMQNAEALAIRLRQRKGIRILLAEDVPLNQEIAIDLLDHAGLTADIADNGAMAVERASLRRYDLVLMDMRMPVMDGLEATRRIRTLPGYAEVPIIAMTANAFSDDRATVIEAGMNDHIPKPVVAEQMYDRLLTWLPAAGTQDAAGSGFRESRPPAAPSTASAATPPDLRRQLAEIDGLDMDQGLGALLGNANRLIKLLGRFALEKADSAGRIVDLLTAGDRAGSERCAHSLKGVAGTLGLTRIAALAAEVEQQIETDGVANVGALAAELATVCPQLQALAERNS